MAIIDVANVTQKNTFRALQSKMCCDFEKIQKRTPAAYGLCSLGRHSTRAR